MDEIDRLNLYDLTTAKRRMVAFLAAEVALLFPTNTPDMGQTYSDAAELVIRAMDDEAANRVVAMKRRVA
jgi:hypothetical protein